jgi:DNA (cytosine-5)-methyltransferase 1
MFGGAVCDPAAERSRATAWDGIRFAEYHRYEVVLVENVVDFRHWELWDSWVHAWRSLGYEVEVVYANSMFFPPTPQSRDRMYVVAWRKGNRKPDLSVTPPAYCPQCQTDCAAVQSWKKPHAPYGKYRTQYVYCCPACGDVIVPYYYCAMNMVDWSLPAPKIAERTRPLKDKTLERIKAGLDRFANSSFLVDTAFTHSKSRRVYGMEEPVPVMTTQNNLGLAVPPFILSYYTRVSGKKAAIAPITDPLPTQPAWALHYLIQPDEATTPEQCGFRMLQPHEVQAAMAFPADYQVIGTQREKIKQLGNAVTPPVMAELFKRCAATLG